MRIIAAVCKNVPPQRSVPHTTYTAYRKLRYTVFVTTRYFKVFSTGRRVLGYIRTWLLFILRTTTRYQIKMSAVGVRSTKQDEAIGVIFLSCLL